MAPSSFFKKKDEILSQEAIPITKLLLKQTLSILLSILMIFIDIFTDFFSAMWLSETDTWY